MNLKSYNRLVWDIETASVKKLFTYGPGYVRLVGYQGDDDEPVVTTNVEELIQLILLSKRHYGFNSLAFDCVALAVHYDVDYRDLAKNNVDLMLVERQINPPRARWHYPKGYWGLHQTVQRHGGDGKTDELPRLAASYGGFDKIPVNDPEYVSYTYGDIEATRFLAQKIGDHYETDPYLPREHKVVSRMIYGMYLNGLRVDQVELEHRLEMQRIKRENNFRKLEDVFGIPLKKREVTRFENPFRVAEGKEWFEKKCDELGISHLVPRTKKGDVSMAEKGIGKMLDSVTDPDAVDFLSCVIAAMDTSDKDAIEYLNEQFGLPLERVEVFESKKPLRTTKGQEMLEYWFTKLGATKVYRTENTGSISTNKEHLEKAVKFYSNPERQREVRMTPMSEENLEKFKELVEVIVDITTERSIYQTIQDNLMGDVVHPSIDAKQASGRWSLRDPGLTVMGKKKGKWREREVILADNDDEVLICFDADQVDARGIAAHSQDKEYAKLFEPGSDMHSEVAKMVFGRCDGEWREKAKVLGHGINYGLGPKGAAAQANVELSVAYQFYENYTRNFVELEKWKTWVRDRATAGFFLDNGFGRNMKADPDRAFTQAPALSGQGCTRDLMAEWILRLDWDCVARIRGIVHDELVASVPKDRVDYYRDKFLEAGTFEFKGIPITAGASKPGESWGACYNPETVDIWSKSPVT